jgi:hypothetical protein
MRSMVEGYSALSIPLHQPTAGPPPHSANGEENDRPHPHPHRTRLANRAVAYFTTHLPLHTQLFGLCDNGAQKIWRD